MLKINTNMLCRLGFFRILSKNIKKLLYSIDWAEIPGFIGATGGLIGNKLIVCGGCTTPFFVSLRLMSNCHISISISKLMPICSSF